MSAEETSIEKGARRGGISRTAVAIIAAVVIVAALIGVAWAAGWLSPQIEFVRIDGSSTVFPITSGWAAEFSTGQRQVVVGFSGTGGGFQKFCRGETDLSGASRPIKQSEIDTCTQNGVTGIVEFLVAYDGLSVVVNKNNNWVDSLTVRQLCRIWTANTSADACDGTGGHVTRWVELNATWPDREIDLYGPGTDSGTFDYFVEVILTPFDQDITADFFPSEDDNVLVQAIAADQDGLGYFGYAYAIANTATLNLLAIDNEQGAGPILPSEETIKDGRYAPLSRPLFVYANSKSLGRPIVRDFLRFGYSTRGLEIVGDTGYVTLTAIEVSEQVAKIPP